MRSQQETQNAKSEGIDSDIYKELSNCDDYRQLSQNTINKLNKLGNVFIKGNQYIFSPSSDSLDCARNFFQVIANEPKIHELIEKFMKDKIRILSSETEIKRHSPGICYMDEEMKTNPPCISFVTATLMQGNEKKHICFVALSGTSASSKNALLPLVKDMLKILDDVANRLNKAKKARQSLYHYVVIMENSDSFYHYILSTFNARLRSCAEKSYSSMLAKLYEQFGDNFKVEGVSNCSLFLFENEIVELKNYAGTQHFERKRQYSDIALWSIYNQGFYFKNIGIEHEIILKPCCKQCQSNKPIYLTAFINFQKYGNELQKMKSKRRLSDIKEGKDPRTSMSTFFNNNAPAIANDVSKLSEKPNKPQKQEKPASEFEIEVCERISDIFLEQVNFPNEEQYETTKQLKYKKTNEITQTSITPNQNNNPVDSMTTSSTIPLTTTTTTNIDDFSSVEAKTPSNDVKQSRKKKKKKQKFTSEINEAADTSIAESSLDTPVVAIVTQPTLTASISTTLTIAKEKKETKPNASPAATKFCTSLLEAIRCTHLS